MVKLQICIKVPFMQTILLDFRSRKNKQKIKRNRLNFQNKPERSLRLHLAKLGKGNQFLVKFPNFVTSVP